MSPSCFRDENSLNVTVYTNIYYKGTNDSAYVDEDLIKGLNVPTDEDEEDYKGAMVADLLNEFQIW